MFPPTTTGFPRRNRNKSTLRSLPIQNLFPVNFPQRKRPWPINGSMKTPAASAGEPCAKKSAGFRQIPSFTSAWPCARSTALSGEKSALKKPNPAISLRSAPPKSSMPPQQILSQKNEKNIENAVQKKININDSQKNPEPRSKFWVFLFCFVFQIQENHPSFPDSLSSVSMLISFCNINVKIM